MTHFAWDDPFDLDSQLSEEERMIRDSARAFAQGELQPRVIDAFREERDAPDLFSAMGRAGLLGVTLPAIHGGAGASYVAYGLIATGRLSLASVVSFRSRGDARDEYEFPTGTGSGR